ncbi:hypothetical protein GFO_1673 [Christiangramia forsetii KT0803]|uniref:Uncharacterized protein n=1 Tax=Christiangramia forsetii (strain DSM 17595 / CGMCC 1.15422 / KT0803) TaxID=411154 RepID=A0M1Z9_CHRFK|nr:hypothetical protein GFO_1673 [Christiangramia forsetii KT0803]
MFKCKLISNESMSCLITGIKGSFQFNRKYLFFISIFRDLLQIQVYLQVFTDHLSKFNFRLSK